MSARGGHNRIEFTLEQQVELMGPRTNADLAREFGTSDMPIRNWRRKNNWLAPARTTTPARAPVGTIASEGVGEIDLLRDEVKRLRAATRRDEKQQVADERALAAIETAAARLERRRIVRPSPLAERVAHEAEGAHHRMLGLWSDWHYGEVVDYEEMSGLNRYDPDICRDRVQQLVRSTLAFKKVRPAVTGLNLAILGDQASGAIHGLEETNAVPAAEQYVQVGEIMAGAVEALAPHFPEVVIDCTFGNHPRATEAPASKGGYNSGDWIAYNMASALTRHLPNVTWNVPRAGMIVRVIAGKTFLFWHGDGVRSSMPGVPWGGVMRRVNVLKATYAAKGIYIDYVCLGHFHQDCVVPGIFMNGALIGQNEYGLKNFGGGEPAKQLIITLDEKRSRPTDVSFITFEEATA